MSLDRQPTLIGASTCLRPLRREDREVLFRVASDPLIWEQHPSRRYERGEFDAFFGESIASGGALLIESRDRHVIGSSRFQATDAPACVEIGWTFLTRSHWGGQTNREVKELMLEHAFMSVKRVRFLVAPENYRSQKAVEKLGAVRLPAAEPAEVVVFELTRDGWASRR